MEDIATQPLDCWKDEFCNLWRHLKRQSEDKSNNCDQWDFTSIQADNLRKHLKTHSGEKLNKCD